jgi:hypothetical protein
MGISNLMDPPLKRAVGRSKHRNVRCEYKGIKFDSKHERSRYVDLEILKQLGEVVRVHRQVMFDLPGGTVAKVDFQIIWADGRVTYEDAKGRRLKSFIRNQKQVHALYGVYIEEV